MSSFIDFPSHHSHQYLIEQQREHQNLPADLRLLIEVVARACKPISYHVSKGALGEALGTAGSENVQGEVQKKLDILSNEILLEANEWGGNLAGMASEEMEQFFPIPGQLSEGRLSADVRSARRLVEHRRQRVDRHDLLGAALPGRPGTRPNSRSCSRARSRSPRVMRCMARKPCSC